MRLSFLMATTLALGAAVATARVITNPSEGALELALAFDDLENIWLANVTDSSVKIDFIEIWSEREALKPGGWIAIADWATADPTGTARVLGAGALGFRRYAGRSGLLAEGSVSGSAVFPPGASWYIGKPIPPSELVYGYYCTMPFVDWFYTKPGIVGDKFLGTEGLRYHRTENGHLSSTAQFYVGAGRAEQGVAYYDAHFYTSAGDGVLRAGSLSMFDADFNLLRETIVGPNYHVGDIAVDSDYVYAPVYDVLVGTGSMRISRFERQTLAHAGDSDISHLSANIAGVDVYEGKLYAIEHSKGGTSKIYRFDLSDLSNPEASCPVWNFRSAGYENGIEIAWDPYEGRSIVMVSCGDIGHSGTIEVYYLAELDEYKLNEPLESCYTFSCPGFPYHAEGLEIMGGSLFYAQGNNVRNTSLYKFRDQAIPGPATLLLLGLGGPALLKRKSKIRPAMAGRRCGRRS